MHAEAVEAAAVARAMRENLTPVLEQIAAKDGLFLARYPHAMLTRILNAALTTMHADMGNIQLLDARSCGLRIQAHHGFGDRFLEFFNCMHDGQTACGTALKNRSQIVVADVTHSSMFRDTPVLEVLLDAGVRAVQSTPLVAPSGCVLGVMSTHWRAPHRPSDRELRSLRVSAAAAGDWVAQRISLLSAHIT
jgi:GAF domain-containing protein